MTYKLYGDFEANPHTRQNCRIMCGSFETYQDAVEYARDVSYSFIEITDQYGNLVDSSGCSMNTGNNFALFAGSDYYPSGGYHDLRAKSQNIDELRDLMKKQFNGRFDWWHIANLNTHTIVESGYR